MSTMCRVILGGIALLGLASPTLARIPDRMPLKQSVVVKMTEAEQELSWTQLDDNMSSITFSNDEWALWEHQYRMGHNVTDQHGNIGPDDEVFRELEDLRDEEIEKRQKFITCYGSGSWARTFVLGGVISGICSGFNYGLSVGARQFLKRTILVTIDGSWVEGWFTHVKNVAGWSSAASCGAALSKVTNDYCADYAGNSGNDPDTAGGEAEDDVGNQFHADVWEPYCQC